MEIDVTNIERKKKLLKLNKYSALKNLIIFRIWLIHYIAFLFENSSVLFVNTAQNKR